MQVVQMSFAIAIITIIIDFVMTDKLLSTAFVFIFDLEYIYFHDPSLNFCCFFLFK